MSMDKDLKLLMVEAMSSTAFAEEVARNIGEEASRKILDEFANEVNRELDKRVKSTVDYYIKNYKKEDIERLVNQAIRDITKKDILEKL